MARRSAKQSNETGFCAKLMSDLGTLFIEFIKQELYPYKSSGLIRSDKIRLDVFLSLTFVSLNMYTAMANGS